jgi:hypothetical protein
MSMQLNDIKDMDTINKYIHHSSTCFKRIFIYILTFKFSNYSIYTEQI